MLFGENISKLRFSIALLRKEIQNKFTNQFVYKYLSTEHFRIRRKYLESCFASFSIALLRKEIQNKFTNQFVYKYPTDL